MVSNLMGLAILNGIGVAALRPGCFQSIACSLLTKGLSEASHVSKRLRRKLTPTKNQGSQEAPADRLLPRWPETAMNHGMAYALYDLFLVISGSCSSQSRYVTTWVTPNLDLISIHSFRLLASQTRL